MTSQEIRKQFLDFFKSKQHTIVSSAPIVVKDDATLMFVNSGMAPFKDLFLGNKAIEHPRIANTQKCLRVSGKHNDLEEVGVDTYHHTFFEMLGNWSFGDYFKQEAIAWSWELLTKVYGLQKDRLYVTVFEGDSSENLAFDKEAQQEWEKWIASDRILKGNKKDNFWEMGDTGPCGPCSEIHYDLRTDEERLSVDGKTLVNAGHPQVVEIWNNVFMEFERKADGSLILLHKKHVDTGMGFERLCMAIQQKTSNYDTDVFTPLIHQVAAMSGITYQGSNSRQDIAVRVIADHIRAVTFTIADGQLPGNNGAGYVIRRILRRAIRYGYSYLKFETPFMHRLVEGLVQQMGTAFPEIKAQKSLIEKVILEEESSFYKTLKSGIKKLDELINQHTESEKIISGKAAFELFDTYGFPMDLTRLIAQEHGFQLDETEFLAEMEIQKNRSRNATQTEAADWIELLPATQIEFVGYDELETKSRIVKYRKIIQKKQELFQIVLNKTPFYAESGGQIGDRGTLTCKDDVLQVLDTKKENELTIHFMDKLPQYPSEIYTATVDNERRNKIIRNHSATHLLHAALRKVLGTHVEQRGSLVEPDKLRFDFSHFSKLTLEELHEIEAMVNHKILENISLEEKRNVPIEQAKALGAMALFGEKYGAQVRVIVFDKNYSVELCGGCHVKSTGQIGFLKIVSESSVAAGIRRIEAITGLKAIEWANQTFQQLEQVRTELNNTKDILKSIANLKEEKAKLIEELQIFEDKQIAIQKKNLLTQVSTVNGVHFLASVKIDIPNAASLRKLSMQLTQELKDNFIILLAAALEGKYIVHLRIAPSLSLNAQQLLKEIAPALKGGGTAEFVQCQAVNLKDVEDFIVLLKNKIK